MLVESRPGYTRDLLNLLWYEIHDSAGAAIIKRKTVEEVAAHVEDQIG
jgi:hypothetical protein